MGYKSILAIVTAAAEARPLITTAAGLCAAGQAHLDVLALGVDSIQPGYAYIGAETMLLDTAMAQVTREAEANEAAARAALDAQSPGLTWALEGMVVQMGMLAEVVASQARFADLVMLQRPYGPDHGTGAEAVLEAALFGARAPVIVLPRGMAQPALPPRRIILAWDQSAEALAAVRHALPFLKSAETVWITVVDPQSHGPERSDPGGMLCQMLVRHGVTAEVTVLARTLPRVSDVLLRAVRDQNADMLVMGAYGHSRFREAILGGATRNMLEEAPVPVFMAH